MEIRTFKGRELHAVMGLVRESLGEEVLIVDTRHLPDRSVEIDVAVQRAPALGKQSSTLIQGGGHSARVRSPEEHPALDLLRGCGFRAPLLDILQDELCNEGSFNDQLVGALTRGMSFDPALTPRKSGSPRVVALVGPTGVGKTTTVAKLAAQLRLAFDLKIALISADSFRIGAAHQLHTYATLLNIPCRTVCPPGASRTGAGMLERIDEALAEFASFDLILVDTSGIGARDRERITLLQESLGAEQFIERMLVLQAPSNDRDLMIAAEAFAPLQYSRLIITKLDESSYCGPILNVAHALRTPLAFFCGGQRVPEDIEPATAKRLAWMITSRLN